MSLSSCGGGGWRVPALKSWGNLAQLKADRFRGGICSISGGDKTRKPRNIFGNRQKR